MKHANIDPVHNRRRFLTQASGAALASIVPGFVSADTTDDLHHVVSTLAKKLADGRVAKLRLLMPHGCEANLQPVIAAFKLKTGITIETVSAPVDEMNTKLSLDRMSGADDYDLALPATFGLPDLVYSGAIIPLTRYAEKYEPSGFRDGILYDIGDSFDSEVYGFQADGDAYTMFYLRELLENVEEKARYADNFGVALEIPDTWPELDRQMAFFNRPEANLSGGLLFRTPGYLAWEWWVRFHAKGYWPLSESLVPQINSDAGLEALEEMIRASESLAPETRTLGLFENWERFSEGNVYCNIGWGGTQKYLNSDKSKVRGRMLYGPTPGGLVDGELLQTPYFNWGWNYVVTATSKHQELAYLFALFASTPAMSAASVRQTEGFFDPFRSEHYQDEGIQNAYSKEFLKVHEKSLRSSIPDLYLALQSDYFQALSEGLNRALVGKTSPERALQRIALQWALITSRTDLTLQKSRWKNLRQKYPPTARRLLRDIV
jgi:multiple sugar transport system substrate-binding protein